MRNLNGHIDLVGGGILFHQTPEDFHLVASLARCAGQHRFGLRVHPQLMHLSGECHLQVGFQSQAEQARGGRSSAADIGALDRQSQRHHFAIAHENLVGG